ncbi:hypothetical protein Fmac_020231 [Flemingia macrophylla]|uniref:Uncharacterized protein n=1 Tax=Flemingia macrophylla TaxID=520843 RepID=A0ABD1LTH8_9FABA
MFWVSLPFLSSSLGSVIILKQRSATIGERKKYWKLNLEKRTSASSSRSALQR